MMAAPNDPFRILFVCMGNICRSPAAELIFRKMAADAGRAAEFSVDSAGTIGYHAGSPPDPRMSQTLRKAGYTVSGAARQIVRKDLDTFDLIVTMDESNHREVLNLDTDPSLRSKIRPFVSFLQSHKEPGIPDPYYGGQGGFDYVIELLEDGCQGMLKALPPKR